MIRIICVLIVLVFGQTCFADELVDNLNLTTKTKVENLLVQPVQNNQLLVETTQMFNVFTPQKNEVVFNESQIVIDAINPNAKTNKSASYLPGARGVNQLVIYTPSHGVRTGTNEFGAEVIIENNIVTEISGADSFIPQNGIVVSGHGKAKTWINTNLKLGTKVYIDKNTLYAYTTSNSYIFESEQKIAETERIIQYYLSSDSGYNAKLPMSYVNDARNYLKKAIKNPEEVRKYSQLAIEASNDALKSVLPYKNGEIKGIWLRPTEKSEREIEYTLDKLKEAGIDNLFIETYFHGKTIYPSKIMQAYGFTVQNELFTGFDPLKIWIKEAHKRGIKIHTWFETFYVGNQNPNDNPNSILAKNPSWGNKLKKDSESPFPSKSSSEHNGYFLDPANPYVQDFLYKIAEEIMTVYKPDGINIDYIRYPNTVSANENQQWGFTEYARNDFFTIYDVDPIYLRKTDAMWAQWNQYKEEQVTNFVKKIGLLGRKTNTYTSVVIFPDRQKTLKNKHQDWKTWSTRNFIDGFTPLFLTCDSKVANSMMKEIQTVISTNTDILAGLFVTFMSGSDEDLIRLIHEMRKMNANGVVLFDYAHLNSKYVNTLSKSVFRTSTKQTNSIYKEQPQERKGWWIFKK